MSKNTLSPETIGQMKLEQIVEELQGISDILLLAELYAAEEEGAARMEVLEAVDAQREDATEAIISTARQALGFGNKMALTLYERLLTDQRNGEEKAAIATKHAALVKKFKNGKLYVNRKKVTARPSLAFALKRLAFDRKWQAMRPAQRAFDQRQYAKVPALVYAALTKLAIQQAKASLSVAQSYQAAHITDILAKEDLRVLRDAKTHMTTRETHLHTLEQELVELNGAGGDEYKRLYQETSTEGGYIWTTRKNMRQAVTGR